MTLHTKPEDLPRGYAETSLPGYLEIRAEQGSQSAMRAIEQRKRDGFPMLAFQILDGEIYDAGIADYGEFFCSLDTAQAFLDNGLLLNGQKGKVSVAHRYTNGAQLKWRPE